MSRTQSQLFLSFVLAVCILSLPACKDPRIETDIKRTIGLMDDFYDAPRHVELLEAATPRTLSKPVISDAFMTIQLESNETAPSETQVAIGISWISDKVVADGFIISYGDVTIAKEWDGKCIDMLQQDADRHVLHEALLYYPTQEFPGIYNAKEVEIELSKNGHGLGIKCSVSRVGTRMGGIIFLYPEPTRIPADLTVDNVSTPPVNASRDEAGSGEAAQSDADS